jgi:protein O-mannosyl-transferase
MASRTRAATTFELEVPGSFDSVLTGKGMLGRLRESRRAFCLAAILAAATLLVYARSWRFGFVLVDDPIYVSENPHVRSGLTSENLAWSVTTFHDGNWVPLTWISLMLDTAIYGFHPFGYHFTNVLLHLTNTLLLFAFLARATGYQLRSALVAALFSLHPLHVESVAWVTERKDVLSTLFGLLSLLAYVRYAARGGHARLGLCFLFFVCSLLAKQTLVTLPFVFLLLDYWPLGRFSRNLGDADGLSLARTPPEYRSLHRRAASKLVLEKAPFLAISAFFSAMAIIAQRSGHAVQALEVFPLAARSLNAMVAYALYLQKTLLPCNLAVYYPYGSGQVGWATVGLAGALLAAASTAAIAGVRRYPFLFVGWAWYLGTLVPMIGIVQVGGQQMADRYTYFPLIGVFIAVVWLGAELVPAGVLRERILPPATELILAALAAATCVQVGYWRDDCSLFEHALEAAEDNAFARNKLGCALVRRAALPEAIAQLEVAVRLGPHQVEPRYNLALALQKAGRLEAALENYRAALAINDRHAGAHNNLGAILLDRGAYAEAKKHFRRAIEIAPNFVQPHMNLGKLCLKTGEYAQAIAASEQALALDRNLLECHHDIAAALLAQGRVEEAVSRLRLILGMVPNDQEARDKLARALATRHAP